MRCKETIRLQFCNFSVNILRIEHLTSSCRLFSALPSLSQFGRGKLSFVAISFYALSLLFGSSRLAGPLYITSINLTNICLLFDLFFSNYIYTQKLILFFFVFASTFRPTMPGYELSSTDRTVIDKKNLCPKCEGLLREAVQTIACGHRYCKTCVETILW